MSALFPSAVPSMALDDVIKEYIIKLYEQNESNVSRTARQLQIDRRTLHAYLERWGYERPGQRRWRNNRTEPAT